MAEKIYMIALSPTMEEGRISSWKVKEGDAVKNGSVLCEVETDKAVMEYESPAEGTILKIVLQEGRSAKVGDLVAIVGKPGEDFSGLLAEAAAAKASGSEQRAEARTRESPAARSEPAEPAHGPAAQGGPAGPEAISASAQPPDAAAVSSAGPLGYGGYPKSSPLARKLAAERGLDLRAIAGSGPDGRVVKRDVEKLAAAGASVEAAVSAGGATRGGCGPEDRTIPVSGMRAVIAKRLSESAFQAPHYFLRSRVVMDQLLDARGRINAETNPKVSLNAFFMKFAAEALKRHPLVNSTWKGSSIEVHGSADVGLAVALPDGLVTPVVRNCGNKGVMEIDRELAVLVDKARKGGLKPEEYSGATFSISNLGNYGIEEFTAIINPPGSAILAVGAVVKEPVVDDDDAIAIRRVMHMTLSCDHRTIDGAVGAAFLKDLATMMEDPLRALV